MRRLPVVLVAVLPAAALWAAMQSAPDDDARPALKPGVSRALGLESPIRIAHDGNGLLVSDYVRRMILRYRKRDMRLMHSFRIGGKPLAVGALEGTIYVGNQTSGRVEAYERDGTFLFQLGGDGVQFTQPNDMAFERAARLAFVVDSQQKLVSVFDLSAAPGQLIGTIPPGGPDPDVLTNPTAIAVDESRQQVLVSDFGAPQQWIRARIQIFDYDGNLLSSISGSSGMLGNRFTRPQGMALDQDAGRIFLVDAWIGQLLILDRDSGETLGSLGTYGFGPGELAMPLDVIRLRRSGRLFVTNNLNRRIEILSDGGGRP